MQNGEPLEQARHAAKKALLDAITRCAPGEHERAARLLARARAIAAGQGDDYLEVLAAREALKGRV